MKQGSKRFHASLIAVAVWLAMGGAAQGQIATAVIKGQVAQAAGGTTVTAVNKDNGANYHTATRSDGSYVLTNLPPGRYELRVGGGASQEVVVSVGETASVDLAGGGAQQVVISGSLTRKDVKTSEVATSITPLQLQRLPQVTRNFLSQADLAPGVSVDTDGEGNVKLRSGGVARSAVNVFIDGVGQKDYVLRGGTTGQDNSRGNPFPQSAIAEYKVTTQNYKAEFDELTGAAISAVTKSGTNELHGDAFIDHTASSLRAATPAERAAGKKSKTRQEQFGASAGGAIVENQIHWFAAYEGKQNRDPRVVAPAGPTAAAALLPDSAKALLGATNSPFHEDLFFGKINWNLSDAHRFDFSLKVRKEKDRKHLGGTETSEFSSDNRVDETRLDLKHNFFSDFITNEARITYERAHFTQDPVSTANGVRYHFVEVLGGGTFNDRNVLDAGGNNFYQRKGQSGFALQNDLTYTGIAGHTIKAGAKIKWITVDAIEQFNPTPQYYYDLNAPDPTTPYKVEFGAPLPGVGNGSSKSRNTMLGLFIQDDWEVNRQLTVNLGVRYDYERNAKFLDWKTPADILAALTGPDPRAPAGQTYAQTLALGGIDINDYIGTGSNRKPFKKALAPRLGFSYDLLGDKTQVVFGGYGRSYDRNIFDVMQLEATKGTFPNYTVNFCNAVDVRANCVPWDPAQYGSAAALRAGATANGSREVNLINNKLRMPYVDQFSIGLRSAIQEWNTTVTLSHLEHKDRFVFLLGNRRPTGAFYAPGAISGPPWDFGVPGFAALILGTNGIKSTTDSLSLQADKPYTRASGWGVNLAYTYSKAKENHNTQDDFTYLLDFPTPGDSPMLASSVTPTHKIVAAGTYDLPWDVTASAKLTLASPKRIRDFNCTAAGCLPDVVEKRSFRQVDVSLGKALATVGGVKLGVRLDVVNLFNYANYKDYEVQWAKHVSYPRLAGDIDGPPRTVKIGIHGSW